MIKLGETVEYMFQLSQFSSGAVYAATGTPAGVVYKNGVADALTVTCTIVNGAGETGLWKAVFTPTGAAGFAAADHVSLRVTATVDGVAGGGIVWQDRIDSADLSDVSGRVPAALTSNGNIKASLVEILTTALTETSGLIAAGFKKFFNIATPTGTVNSLPDAVPGASGGLPTVGTGSGQINPSSGKIPATIAAGDLATDSITAAALKTDAVTEITNAIAALTSYKELRAFARGKVVITGDQWAFYDTDNTTVLFTLTVGAGGRTVA